MRHPSPLCRKFLATLDDSRWVSAYMPNPSLEPRTLLLGVERLRLPPLLGGHQCNGDKRKRHKRDARRRCFH